MDNDTTALIITIAVAALSAGGITIGVMTGLLVYLGKRIDRVADRIDQAEARVMQSAAKDKAELLDAMRDLEGRVTQSAAKDKAELQETIRDLEARVAQNKAEVLEALRDTERRLGYRIDRLEDRMDNALLRGLGEPAREEQPVAEGD